MAMQRRCLISGCGCKGYVRNMESYDPESEERVAQRYAVFAFLCGSWCGNANSGSSDYAREL